MSKSLTKTPKKVNLSKDITEKFIEVQRSSQRIGSKPVKLKDYVKVCVLEENGSTWKLL